MQKDTTEIQKCETEREVSKREIHTVAPVIGPLGFMVPLEWLTKEALSVHGTVKTCRAE